MKSLNRRRCGWWTAWAITVGLAGIHSVAAAVSAIPIRNTLGDTNAAVGFQKDILPMFQANCLPCHNQTRAKAGLNLRLRPPLARRRNRAGRSGRKTRRESRSQVRSPSG